MFLFLWCLALTLITFYYSFNRTLKDNKETWSLMMTPDRFLGIITIWVLYAKLH